MPDLPLGLFRTLKPVTAKDYLVAQVSTGTTYFNYLKLGTNSTETEGKNIVYGSLINAYSAGIKSLTWVEPSSGDILTTCYYIGDLQEGAPAAEIPTYVKAKDLETFILFNGDYVARLPGLDLSTIVGGAHLQTINNVRYIVAYRVNSGYGVITLTKYRVALDEALDQTTIPLMAVDKEIQYTDTSGADWTSVRPNLINPYGPYTGTNTGVNAEQTYTIIPQARDLVCNADGSKTVFYFGRSYNGENEANYHAIFELVDTETEFSLTELTESHNTLSVPTGSDTVSEYQTGEITNNSTWDLVNCPNSEIHNVNNYSGTLDYTQKTSTTGTVSTWFLGCSYNRVSNSIELLKFREIESERVTDENRTYTHSGSTTYVDGNQTSNTHTIDFTWTYTDNPKYPSPGNQKHFELYIEDIAGNELAILYSTKLKASQYKETATITRTLATDIDDITYNKNVDYTEVGDFGVIDFSNHVLAISEVIHSEITTQTTSQPANYEVSATHYHFIVNGNGAGITSSVTDNNRYILIANDAEYELINNATVGANSGGLDYTKFYFPVTLGNDVCSPDAALECGVVEHKDCTKVDDGNW